MECLKKINVLDKHLAQLIAAGEVVERPCSVVKELLENSIDSGATKISCEISHGGSKLIRIIDNGSGIYKEDVKNAFLRHATSKLKSEEDLEKIYSLGFRGEALASICAVSNVQILTRAKSEEFGTELNICGGNFGEVVPAGRSVGTTISVRDLFFNVPARMKFLKKDVTEANLCASVIDKLALSHPEISFRFIRDGKEVLNTAGDGQVSSAIYGVYGKDFFSGMIPVEYKYENVEISGYISKPLCCKSTRSMQNFFVNGRYIKNKIISVALEEAFKNSIMVGKFPYCVIYIKVPYSSVDVNVHPTKTEVKFSNEKKIFDAIYYGVKTALMNNSENNAVFKSENSFLDGTKLGDVSHSSEQKSPFKFDENQNTNKNIVYHKGSFVPESGSFNYKSSMPDMNYDKQKPYSSNSENDFKIENPKVDSNLGVLPDFKSAEPQKKADSQETFYEPKPEAVQTEIDIKKEELKIIGEIFDCYIVIQKSEKVILVDKHAAHERIIFEKLKQNDGSYDSQSLLEPIVITLEKQDYNAILENLDMLEKVGFKIEDFGSGSIMVRSAPMYMVISNIEDSVMEIAKNICMGKKSLNTEKLDWLYENIACRSAVKAGNKSTLEEITALVKELEENPEIQHCPHGRPVFVTFNKKDIEKQFGRL